MHNHFNRTSRLRMANRSFLRATLCLLLALLLTSSVSEAQSPAIRIDEIEKDQLIQGQVINLPNPEEYRVLIYVHTDQWYIHPYAGQGEGLSWASIDSQGDWSLRTVKREFTANSVAALIVEPAVADTAPSPLVNVSSIRNRGLIVYTLAEMRTNGWHGKL